MNCGWKNAHVWKTTWFCDNPPKYLLTLALKRFDYGDKEEGIVYLVLDMVSADKFLPVPITYSKSSVIPLHLTCVTQAKLHSHTTQTDNLETGE